jgi:pimeloyl-ACP methyl ester carboxylesterase
MNTKKLKYSFLTKSIGFYVNFIGFFASKKAAAIAFRIFCNPRKGKLQADQLPETLKSATLEKFECENEFFQAYIWNGNEQIIILAHGWESNANRWRKMLPYLIQTGKTIVAIDAPAHGLSTGKDFNAPKYSRFIASLSKKYNPEILIGHSIGGFACIYYQYISQNPNLKKIILLGAPSDLDLMFLNYYKLIGMSKRVQNQFNKLVETKIESKISDFNAKDFVKKINAKGLIVHDLKDYVVPIKEGRKIHKNWKSASILETNGYGHGLNVKEIFEEIIEFIKE